MEQKLIKATNMSMGKVPERQLPGSRPFQLTLVQPIPSFNPLCTLQSPNQGSQYRSGPIISSVSLHAKEKLPVI
jgi:hypothetical protein